MRDRQRPQQQRVDEAEDGGGANAQGEERTATSVKVGVLDRLRAAYFRS